MLELLLNENERDTTQQVIYLLTSQVQTFQHGSKLFSYIFSDVLVQSTNVTVQSIAVSPFEIAGTISIGMSRKMMPSE